MTQYTWISRYTQTWVVGYTETSVSGEIMTKDTSSHRTVWRMTLRWISVVNWSVWLVIRVIKTRETEREREDHLSLGCRPLLWGWRGWLFPSLSALVPSLELFHTLKVFLLDIHRWSQREHVKVDMLIWLSEASLLGWFSKVSVIIKVRSQSRSDYQRTW